MIELTVVIWSVVMLNTADTDFNTIPDEALVKVFQTGDRDVFSVLVARYLKLVRVKACSFREIFSLEREDLYQEGLLGLFDAACSYRTDGPASFETYAGRCINNRIVSAVRRSASQKNALLNHAIPLEEISGADVDVMADPQDLLETRAEIDHMLETVHVSLSVFERRVLSLYLSGYKRSEVEARGIPMKAFDNAMVRVRKKLRQK